MQTDDPQPYRVGSGPQTALAGPGPEQYVGTQHLAHLAHLAPSVPKDLQNLMFGRISRPPSTGIETGDNERGVAGRRNTLRFASGVLVAEHRVRFRVFVRSLDVDPDWVDNLAWEAAPATDCRRSPVQRPP